MGDLPVGRPPLFQIGRVRIPRHGGIIRLPNGDPSAPSTDTAHLTERGYRVSEVLKHLVSVDDVEACIRAGERHCIRALKACTGVPAAGGVLACCRAGRLGEMARAELARDVHWAAPEHLLVETFSAVRGLTLGHQVGAERATDALGALEEAAIELLPVAPLLRRMWELRDHLSGYDAACVAAAAAHGCPLLTADRRLAQAASGRCEVSLIVPR